MMLFRPTKRLQRRRERHQARREFFVEYGDWLGEDAVFELAYQGYIFIPYFDC